MGDTKNSKIRKPDRGPGASRPLVGCKGNAQLGCPRVFAPRKLNVFVILNSFKRLLLVDDYNIEAIKRVHVLYMVNTTKFSKSDITLGLRSR